MKKGFVRWTVGLLAGGALAMAGCGGNRSDEGDRETGASRTPTQDRFQPPEQDEAQARGRTFGHPAAQDRDQEPGHAPRSPVLGGTAAPSDVNTQERMDATGGSGMGSDVQPAGLGTSLADAYRVPAGGGAATGGGGVKAGTSSGAGSAGSAVPGTTSGGTTSGGMGGGGGSGGAGGGGGGAGGGGGSSGGGGGQ